MQQKLEQLKVQRLDSPTDHTCEGKTTAYIYFREAATVLEELKFISMNLTFSPVSSF